jgi:hypothetical protein
VRDWPRLEHRPGLGRAAADWDIHLKMRRNPMAVCGHLDQIADVTPSSPGCEDCLAAG